MNSCKKYLEKKIFITQKLKTENLDLSKWIFVETIKDKNLHGTEINPNSVEIIFSVITFEIDKKFIGTNDDITLDDGENVEIVYAYSIEEVLELLSKKNIDPNKFIPVSEDLEFPL